MKKILIFILFFALFGGINQSFASTSYTSISGITECENQTRNDNSGKKFIPKSNNNNAPDSGDFDCENHWYYSGSLSEWQDINTIYNCPDKKYASSIQWNGDGNKYKIYCKEIDDIAPDPSNITNDNPKNLLANDTKSYYIKIDKNGGSDIDHIKFQLEDYNNNTNSFLTEQTDNSSLWGTGSWNISKVDNDIQANGSRQYTFKLTEICDKAGNCWNGEKNYIHNVYSNSNHLGTFEFNSTTDFNIGKIADGTPYKLKATLKDTYGNNIIKADGIHRTIDFNFNTNHNLNLDQYNNTGNAVYLTKANKNPNTDTNYTNKILTGSNINTEFNNQESDNGKYNFYWKIYSPTNLSYDSDNHDFIINFVKIDINQLDTTNTNISNITNINLGSSNNINFNFKPLYTTSFSGKQVDNGFIEGVTQTGGYIKIENKNISTTISGQKIFLQKSGTASGTFIGTGIINNTIENINNGYTINKPVNYHNFYTFDSSLSTQSPKFTTLFTLNPAASEIKNIKNLNINSWLNYKIDINGTSTTILYAGNILGSKINSANAGLKIYGISNIDKSKQREITEGQDEDIKNIDGKIDKASLKKDIRSKAFKIIKNIKIESGTNDKGEEITIGTKYKYYNFSGNPDGILELNVNNIKNTNITYIVLGGNLYLNGGNSLNNEINLPGIIVLKDENGNGGKLYIDPNISRINAAIYVDKSILSYNTSYGEISPNNGGTYEVLKNQLYINGSVFSENTIGGSRINPPVCPFYLNYTTSQCSLDEAQKYDLNYLRRGIENKQASKGDYPVIIEYNTKLQFNPPALFDN